jgi:transposase
LRACDQRRERNPKLAATVVQRSDLAQGFEVLPKRWIVERTESSGYGWGYLAMIRIMLRQLA